MVGLTSILNRDQFFTCFVCLATILLEDEEFPFVWDYPGEPVPEETFANSPIPIINHPSSAFSIFLQIINCKMLQSKKVYFIIFQLRPTLLVYRVTL